MVAPVIFLLLFGLISASYLFYQNSALHDGASAGARTASIESSLTSNGGCESGQPLSIEKSVAQAAPLLTVNPAALCSNGATQLTQTPNVAGDVNITVTCGTSCAAPTSVSVALVYASKGIVSPLNLTYTMQASSQVPMLTP